MNKGTNVSHVMKNVTHVKGLLMKIVNIVAKVISCSKRFVIQHALKVIMNKIQLYLANRVELTVLNAHVLKFFQFLLSLLTYSKYLKNLYILAFEKCNRCFDKYVAKNDVCVKNESPIDFTI